MPSLSPSIAAPVLSRPRPPKLNDASRYVRVDRVPIIDTCERSYFKTDPKTGKQIRVDESIDRNQLKNILENSRQRAEKGEYGIVFLGHTNDGDSETNQPPIAGYLDNYQLGEHEGQPTILADMYIDKEDCDPSKTLRQFPRRSAEIIAISKPTGYIDSVALLKRTPERQLGLVTSHYNNKSKDIYRFECPECEKSHMAKPSMTTGMMAEHEEKEAHKKKKKDVIKNVLTLTQMLVDSMIEEEMEEKSNNSDSSETSEEDEPSMPATKSKYRKEEAQDASNSTSSSSSSEPSESSSSEPSMKGKKKERAEPSRMDPSEPSRMSKKKSKMQAGGGPSGTPGPMTSTPASAGESDKGEGPPVVKVKSRMSRDDRERTRMSEDSDRISRNHLQRELKQRDETIEKLLSRFSKIDEEKREAVIERKIAQLEAEGYELKRPDEVARFKKYFQTDEEVDEEITRMRSVYRQSPVNQQMIPSFSPDLGGASVPRQKSVHELLAPNPADSDPRNPGVFAPIVGARFARRADAAGKIPKREPGGSQRGGVDLTEISRFVLEESAKER
jgi:hypothetical protein